MNPTFWRSINMAYSDMHVLNYFAQRKHLPGYNFWFTPESQAASKVKGKCVKLEPWDFLSSVSLRASTKWLCGQNPQWEHYESIPLGLQNQRFSRLFIFQSSSLETRGQHVQNKIKNPGACTVWNHPVPNIFINRTLNYSDLTPLWTTIWAAHVGGCCVWPGGEKQ